MAATSQHGREYAGRDESPLAWRRVFDQRDGLARRVHQDHYLGAVYTIVRPGQTVADEWVGQAVVRWDAGRCRALCQEAVRDCRWASVAGEELVFVLSHRAKQPQGVRRQVA